MGHVGACLAVRPAARQQSRKQLAHSPQRPHLVSSSFSTSLYRGKRVVLAQLGAVQLYTSVREASCAASAGEGGEGPTARVGALQTVQAGASTCVPQGRLDSG